MVNRFKVWLLRWLGVVPASELDRLKSALKNFIDEAALQSELNALRSTLNAVRHQHEENQDVIANLVQELHNLRNSIPVAVTQDIKQPVRVFRNFREFKSVVEGRPQAFPIERKS